MAAYNVFHGRELILRRLQMSGAPLVTPTAADVLVIDYPQQLVLGRVRDTDKVIKNEGPEETICEINKKGKLIGANLGLTMAKYPPQLAYLFEGGTYVFSTDIHTPPFRDGADPYPFSVEAYCEKYTDGQHLHGDFNNYLKLYLPKCTGTFADMTIGLDAIANPNVTINSEEYVDEATPGNSKPCYSLIPSAGPLPSAGTYTQKFHCVKAADQTDLAGVLVSVTVNGTPVTDTSDVDGIAELTLPYGSNEWTASMTLYTTQTGTVVVGVVNDDAEIEMVLT